MSSQTLKLILLAVLALHTGPATAIHPVDEHASPHEPGPATPVPQGPGGLNSRGEHQIDGVTRLRKRGKRIAEQGTQNAKKPNNDRQEAPYDNLQLGKSFLHQLENADKPTENQLLSDDMTFDFAAINEPSPEHEPASNERDEYYPSLQESYEHGLHQAADQQATQNQRIYNVELQRQHLGVQHEYEEPLHVRKFRLQLGDFNKLLHNFQAAMEMAEQSGDVNPDHWLRLRLILRHNLLDKYEAAKTIARQHGHGELDHTLELMLKAIESQSAEYEAPRKTNIDTKSQTKTEQAEEMNQFYFMRTARNNKLLDEHHRAQIGANQIRPDQTQKQGFNVAYTRDSGKAVASPITVHFRQPKTVQSVPDAKIIPTGSGPSGEGRTMENIFWDDKSPKLRLRKLYPSNDEIERIYNNVVYRIRSKFKPKFKGLGQKFEIESLPVVESFSGNRKVSNTRFSVHVSMENRDKKAFPGLFPRPGNGGGVTMSPDNLVSNTLWDPMLYPVRSDPNQPSKPRLEDWLEERFYHLLPHNKRLTDQDRANSMGANLSLSDGSFGLAYQIFVTK